MRVAKSSKAVVVEISSRELMERIRRLVEMKGVKVDAPMQIRIVLSEELYHVLYELKEQQARVMFDDEFYLDITIEGR